MAFDMKVFEDLLGDDMTDDYRSLLGNIGGQQAAPPTNASAFGFDPDRHHGVQDLGQIIGGQRAADEKSRANLMLKQAQQGQQYHQQELARLNREAQLQSAANQFQHMGNQRAQQKHSVAGMNNYYSALQQEKLRQQRAGTPQRNPYADQFGVGDMLGAITNPIGFLGKTIMGAMSGPAKKQPNAQQRQARMQQMLRGK